jgi:hypothetical protein
MPTVIESLVVSLSLDTTQFTTEQQAAVKHLKNIEGQSGKTGQSLHKSGSSAAEAFSKLKRELISIVGIYASVSGIKTFVSNMLDSTASVQRLSDNFAINKKEIFEWRAAAEQAGGTAEDATSAISKANEEFARFRKYREVSQGVMVNGVDISSATSGLDLLLKKSEAIARVRRNVLEKGGTQTDAEAAGNLASSELGIAASLYPILKDGPEAAKKLLRANAELVNEQMKLAGDSEELRKAWNKVSNELAAAGIEVLNHFMKPLQDLAAWLVTDQFKQDLISFSDGVGTLATVVEWVAKLFNLVGKAIGNSLGWISRWGASRHKDRSYDIFGDSSTQPSATPTGPLSTGEQKEAKLRIINKLKAMGFTTDQAKAITGNLQAESSLNPGSYNPKGGGQGARGLANWRGARQDAFKAMFGHGLDKGTEDEQLKFLKSELDTNPGYKNALSGSSVGEMTEAFARIYEAPSATDLSASLNKRLGYAGALGANATAVGKSASNSSSTTVNIDSVNIKTAATDAPGIAGTIKPAIHVAMATTGVH